VGPQIEHEDEFEHDHDQQSSRRWFERSETFKYLGQLLATLLEKLLPEMI
jgi:hypothetical protein